MRLITLLIILNVIFAYGFLQGKILDYDGETVTFSIYYPDYERDIRASEHEVNLDVRFLIFQEYLNGRKEQQTMETSVKVLTNTNEQFRYLIPINSIDLRRITINLVVEGFNEDIYIVNFVRD